MCHQGLMVSLLYIWSKCHILCCSLQRCITWESPETSVSCSFVPVQEAWRTPPNTGAAACYHLAPEIHTNTHTQKIREPIEVRAPWTRGQLGSHRTGITSSNLFLVVCPQTGFTIYYLGCEMLYVIYGYWAWSLTGQKVRTHLGLLLCLKHRCVRLYSYNSCIKQWMSHRAVYDRLTGFNWYMTASESGKLWIQRMDFTT